MNFDIVSLIESLASHHDSVWERVITAMTQGPTRN